jgi:hypothetical protein
MRSTTRKEKRKSCRIKGLKKERIKSVKKRKS